MIEDIECLNLDLRRDRFMDGEILKHRCVGKILRGPAEPVPTHVADGAKRGPGEHPLKTVTVPW